MKGRRRHERTNEPERASERERTPRRHRHGLKVLQGHAVGAEQSCER